METGTPGFVAPGMYCTDDQATEVVFERRRPLLCRTGYPSRLNSTVHDVQGLLDKVSHLLSKVAP